MYMYVHTHGKNLHHLAHFLYTMVIIFLNAEYYLHGALFMGTVTMDTKQCYACTIIITNTSCISPQKCYMYNTWACKHY